jgi:hypothetical protein
VVASISLTWVTTRAAGYTAFTLLTLSVALGLVLSSPLRSKRWPRFATTELHRFVTLLTLVFIGVHVLVAMLDRFISFRLVEVLVPFTSHYRPLWMGLGIVSAYLAAAVWASSWLQRRIGYSWWRRMHYATFAVYAGAAAHGLGSGSDAGWAWSRAIYVASFVIVGGLLIMRLPARDRPAPARANARPRVERAHRSASAPAMAAGMAAAGGVVAPAAHHGTAIPAGTTIPVAPDAGAGASAAGGHADDAAADAGKADATGAATAGPGTPLGTRIASDAHAGTTASNARGWVEAAYPPVHAAGFSARLDGRLWQGPNGDGAMLVALDGALHSGFDGQLQLRVFGRMAPGTSRLEVVDNRLWLLGRDGTTWTGRIELFDSLRLRGAITAQRAGARPLTLEIDLFGFTGEATSGMVRALPNAGADADPATSLVS